jgi:hypothetical protein
MISSSWPLTVPEGIYVISGIIYFLEQEEDEESFSSDLLSRHPDCLALPMLKEYIRLYGIHGEEKTEAYLEQRAHQQNIKLGAADDEINTFARKLADQFTRLPHHIQKSGECGTRPLRYRSRQIWHYAAMD